LTAECVTRLLTGSAGLSADPTVLHPVLRMLLALISAKAAGRGTRLEGRSNHVSFERGLTRDDAAGRITEIGTIEIEPDAASERFRVGLTQTRISAGRTRLRAVETGTDAGHEGAIGDDRLRMRLDHGLRKTHGDSSE
jgi:hypothetical protein